MSALGNMQVQNDLQGHRHLYVKYKVKVIYTITITSWSNTRLKNYIQDHRHL